MKKFLLVLASVLVFYACSDNEKTFIPAPEITDVVIDGSSEDTPLRIELGETLSFSLNLKEQMDVTYSWLLDEKEVSTAEKFVFTPDKTGEYQLNVVLTNKDGIATPKEVGVIEVIHPIPVITGLFSEDKEISGEIEITATSKHSFEVKADKASDAIYYWLINGDTIQDANEPALEYDLGISGKLTVTIENKDNVSVSKDVELVGPYKNGVYIFGTSYTGLCFISEDGVQEKDNIYETVNEGEKLGDSGINDFVIYNNKVYILIPSISYSDKRAQIVVADAQTMKKIDAITATGFSSADLGTIYNLAIINENKAYIGSNKIAGGNISSVKVLDMKEKMMAEAEIEGTSGKIGSEGPAWARMLTIGERTLVACGPKVQVINNATDKVEKTIDFEAGQVVDIVKGRDNTIYALVNPKASGSPATIAAINKETFAVDTRTELAYNSKNITFNSGGMTNARVAVSPVSDDILFSVAGPNAWSSSSEIYKYNYTSQEVELFADVKNNARATAMNGYMGIDSKGILFVPLSGQYSYQNEAIIAYDVKTGDLLTTSYSRLKQGEGNVVPTWMFK